MKAYTISIINKIAVMLLLSGLIAMSSCRKLLEIPPNPTNAIAQQAVFADSASTISAISGVYSNFPFLDGTLSKLFGLAADELNTSNTSDPGASQFYSNVLTTDNSYAQNFWTSIYSGIYKTNVCLEGVGGSKGLSTGLKQQLTGELKVVRALYYFHLVNMFGAVPLATTTSYQVTDTLSRATADQLYTQILSDLLDAQKLLTATYPSPGKLRPNLYTAEALLAKVYLYRQSWQEAFTTADQVIGSGSYQLETDLNNVFLDGSQEAIWQLPSNSTYIMTNEAANYLPYSPAIVPAYFLSDPLTNAFETGDQRWVNWANFNTVNTTGTDQLFYYPYKYKNLYAPYPTTEDFMVLRLADQYLIRAEASAHLNNLTGAVADLDQVRQRAGLKQSTAVAQNEIITAVLKERQTELFTEWGNRWFDLKRTNTIDAVLSAEKPGWKPSAALLPIPINEIRSNYRLTQNPGYN